jgi:Leucine-rich repeat (LRR) protein
MATDSFDPYHKWLGISPREQPADYYRLLGLPRFEDDPEVIDNAADSRMAYVRKFQTGQRAKITQHILNELSVARVCLLDSQRKEAYDERLRAASASDDRPKPPARLKSDVPRAGALNVQTATPIAPPLRPVTSTGSQQITPTSMRSGLPVWALPALLVGTGLSLIAVLVVFLIAAVTRPAAEIADDGTSRPSTTLGRRAADNETPVRVADPIPQPTEPANKSQRPNTFGERPEKISEGGKFPPSTTLIEPASVGNTNDANQKEVGGAASSSRTPTAVPRDLPIDSLPAKQYVSRWVVSSKGVAFVESSRTSEGARRRFYIRAPQDIPEEDFTFESIRLIRKTDNPLTDSDLETLGLITELRSLFIGDAGITDEGLRQILHLGSLRHLSLSNCGGITDECLEHLVKLPLSILEIENTRITDQGLEHLGRLTSLNILNLKNVNITDQGLPHLESLSKLTSLTIEGSSITDDGLRTIGNFSSLISLNVGGNPAISDRGLGHLHGLAKLEGISLSGTKISADGVLALDAAFPESYINWKGGGAVLASSVDPAETEVAQQAIQWGIATKNVVLVRKYSDVGIQNVRISNANNVVDGAFNLFGLQISGNGKANGAEILTDLPKTNALRSLRLAGLELNSEEFQAIGNFASLQQFTSTSDLQQVSREALQSLARLSQLRAVDLYGSSVTDRVIEQLDGLPNLERVRIANSEITDRAFLTIGQLPSLRELDVSFASSITDQGLAHLKACTKLRQLRLRNAKISYQATSAIAEIASIETLDLGETDVTDQAVLPLVALPRLHTLFLYSTKVTDEAINHLVAMKSLVTLGLSRNSRVTDAGLRRLQAASQLEHVSLEGTNVTADGVESFRKALPTCKVTWLQK